MFSRAVGVGRGLGGHGVLDKGVLATEYELVGDGGQQAPDGGVPSLAWYQGKVRVEVKNGARARPRAVTQPDADASEDHVKDGPDIGRGGGGGIPAELIAGGPAVGQGPAVETIEGKGAEVSPGLSPERY